MNAISPRFSKPEDNDDRYSDFIVFMESGMVSYFHGPHSQFPDYVAGLTGRAPGQSFVVIRTA